MLPGEIGDIDFPPRALEHYAAALGATHRRRADAGPPVQGRHRLRATASTSFVMPNVLAKLGAEVLAVNPYASTAGDPGLRPGPARRSGGGAGPGLGRPPRRGDRPRRRAAHADRRHRPRAQRHRGAARAARPAVGDDRSATGVALPVAATARTPKPGRRHGGQVRPTKMATAALMEAAAGRRRRLRRQPGRRLHPARLPARLRRRRHVRQDARPAGPPRASGCPRWWPSCRPVHMVHETVVTPWEQKGMVMRTLVEQHGTARSSSSTG